jgi:hypothetical protein
MEGARLSLIIVINQCGRLVVMPDCCIVLAFIWPDSSRSENFVRADGGIPDFDGGGIPDLWKRAVLWTLAVLIVFHAISSISALVALRPIGLLLSKLQLQTSALNGGVPPQDAPVSAKGIPPSSWFEDRPRGYSLYSTVTRHNSCALLLRQLRIPFGDSLSAIV